MPVKDPERRREIQRAWYARNKEQCLKYSKVYDKSPKRQAYFAEYRKKNVDKKKAWSAAYQQANKEYMNQTRWEKPERKLFKALTGARQRSVKAGWFFDENLFKTLVLNPPTNCAACNVILDYKGRGHAEHATSPRASLDRINNKLGYTVENVAVLCMRCNVIKAGWNADDIRPILAYIDRESSLRNLQDPPPSDSPKQPLSGETKFFTNIKKSRNSPKKD